MPLPPFIPPLSSPENYVPYSSYTEEDKKNILLNEGLDPNEYWFDPLTSTAYKNRPKVENSDPTITDENVTGEVKRASKQISRSEAVGAALKASILPSVGGASLASLGMRLGAAGGPIGMTVGGLLGGVGGAFGTSYLQNKFGVVSPETLETLKQAEEQYPVMTPLVEMAPNALFFNPLKAIGQLPKLASGVGKVARGALMGPAERAALQNAGVNVGINTGLEAGQELYNEGKVDPLQLALRGVAGGLLFNEPTALGRKMGFPSTEPIAYPQAQEGEKTVVRGYLPEPQKLLEEGTPPVVKEEPQKALPSMPEYKALPPATEAGPAPRETIKLDNGKFGNEEQQRVQDFAKAQRELEEQRLESIRLETEKQKQLNEQRRVDLAIGNKKGYGEELPAAQRLQEKIKGNQIPPEDRFPQPKESYQSRTTEETPTGNQQFSDVEKAQEEHLLKNRGLNVQEEPDLQFKGKSSLGEFIPQGRKVRISQKGAVVTTRSHEGLHGFLNDLRNSPMGRDKKLYRKAIEAGESLRNSPEKLGPNDKDIISQMETEGASREDIAEELLVRHSSVEDVKRLLARSGDKTKGTFGEFWRDVKSNIGYKLGSSNPETIMKHLTTRYNFDAPYGTRTDVLPPKVKTEETPPPIPKAANQLKEEDLPPEIHQVLKATPDEMRELPKKWGVPGQTYKSDELAGKLPNTPEVHKMLDDMASKGDTEFRQKLINLGGKKMTEQEINDLAALSMKGQFFREIKGKMLEGKESTTETPKQSRAPEDIMGDMEKQIRDEGFERGKKVINAAKQVRQEHATEGEVRDYNEANKDYKHKLDEINAFTDEDHSRQSRTQEDDLNGVTRPEKYSFAKVMESQIDKVRRVGGQLGKDIADAGDKYFTRKQKYEGQFSNTPQYDIDKLGISDEELAKVAKTRRALFRGEGRAEELTGKEKAANDILTRDWEKLRNEQIAKGLNVEMPRMRPGERFNPNFIQDILSDESMHLFTKKAGSPEAKQAERQWINYALEHETGEARNTVVDNIQKYIKALGGNKMYSNKALNYGIPENLRETNLRKIIRKYGRRSAQDLAYWAELQSNPKIAAGLGLPKRGGGLSTMEGVEDLSTHPDVQGLKKFIFNDFQSYKHPTFFAAARLAVNSMLGGATGIRNTVQLPAFISPYVETFGDLKAIFKGIANIGDVRRKSIEYGVRSGKMDLDRWHYLENPNKWTQFFSRAAEIARKYQGRDLLEQGDRLLSFSIGREMAINKILEALNGRKQSLEWLKKFGTLENITPENLRNIDVDQIAANFATRVQGSYDARGLPVGAFDSDIAPFLSFTRWNIEKSNVLWKDVIEPAKKGNWKPLLVYTLGTALSGAAIKEINELLSGKKEYSPSLQEAVNKDKKEFQLAAVINMMQMGSYMGLMGDLMKASSDMFIQKDLPRSPLTFPAMSFAEDFAYTLGDFRTALDNHVDPIDAFLHFGWEVMRESTQNLRLLDSRVLNQEDTERSNRFRDLRVFKKLEGENMPFAAGQYRRNRISEASPERQFKKETDLAKAAGEVPELIQNAIKDANGDPFKLKKNFESLKINSYQTMPNIKENPLEFQKFYQFLKDTQGEEEASKTLSDYFQKEAINQAKSRMIP